MPITVVTPVTDRNLLTITEILEELGLEKSQYHLVGTLLSRASAAVEAWCGRRFVRERVIETWLEAPRKRVRLSRTPIAQSGSPLSADVHSVTYNDEALTDWRVLDVDAGLLELGSELAANASFDRYPGPAHWYYGDARWPGLAVDYTGGPATAPEPVRQAVVETVRSWLDARDRAASLQRMSVDGVSETYASAPTAQAGLPAVAIQLLAAFRRPLAAA